MEANIPSRQQIMDKIDEIKNNPQFSTIQTEIDQRVSAWLDSLNLPEVIVISGVNHNPKELIMSDLKSYPNY